MSKLDNELSQYMPTGIIQLDISKMAVESLFVIWFVSNGKQVGNLKLNKTLLTYVSWRGSIHTHTSPIAHNSRFTWKLQLGQLASWKLNRYNMTYDDLRVENIILPSIIR